MTTAPPAIVALWTASWSSEERFFVAPCRYAMGQPAICQPQSRLDGRPLFSKPHSIRQRKAMALGLCDLCGGPLGDLKVSLSFGRGTDVGHAQVEPMLHVGCAASSVRYCPHLKRHAAAGTIRVQQVLKFGVAVARLTAAAVLEFTGERHRDGAVFGHAKILVDRSIDRDLGWFDPELPAIAAAAAAGGAA